MSNTESKKKFNFIKTEKDGVEKVTVKMVEKPSEKTKKMIEKN